MSGIDSPARVEPRSPPPPTFWNRPGLRRFRRHKLAVFGAAAIVLMTLACIFGPMLLPYTDTFIDIRQRFAPPFSGPHVLGHRSARARYPRATADGGTHLARGRLLARC